MKSILAIMLIFGSINVFAHTSELNCTVGASVVAINYAKLYTMAYIRTPEGLSPAHYNSRYLRGGHQHKGTIAKFFTTDIYKYGEKTLLKKNAKMAVLIHEHGEVFKIMEQDLICL